MNNFICNYDLHFSHPSKKRLYEFFESSKDFLSFDGFIDYDKNSSLFVCKGSTAIEETAEYSFLDILKDLLDNNENLDFSGSFNDNYGKGLVDSFLQKQYTSTH